MKGKYICLFTFLLICNFSYAQIPRVYNYPLVKGIYKSAVKNGQFLHCLTDFGLMNWDVSNPQSPQLVSKLPAPGYYTHGKIARYNEFIFIQRYDTVIVADISNIAAPVYATHNVIHNSFVNDIVIQDSVLYVASNNISGLTAYDITDISNSSLIYSGPFSFIDDIVLYDTNMFVYNSSNFYRLNIRSSLPQLIDSIIINPLYLIIDAVANNKIAALFIGDAFNFNQPVSILIYDLTTLGMPTLIDSIDVSSVFSLTLEGITDSLLFVCTDSVIVFDITNPANPIAKDTLGQYYRNELIIDDSLIYIMSGSKGFDIFNKDEPFGYSIYSENKVGDSFEKIDISNSGQVFVKGLDSMFIFNKTRTTSETSGDFTFRNHSEEFAIIDNYLVQTEIDGNATLRISGLDNFPVIDSIITVSGGGFSYLNYLKIWDGKLYNYVHLNGTEIYDISDSLNPVFIAGNVPTVYNHYYNGVLYDLATLFNEVHIYNPTVVPPQFIRIADVEGDDCPPDAFWESQRALAHFWCSASSNFYQLDYSDTSDIHFTQRVPLTTFTSGGGQISNVWNRIMYIQAANQIIYIFDVCDINHFRLISEFRPMNFFEDFVLTDSMLYIAFPGYVASYDVSLIKPCLFSGTHEINNDYDIQIFPNPSDGRFALQFFSETLEAEIIISDITGSQIISRNIRGQKNKLIKCDFNIERSGVYLLKIKDGNHTQMRKLVVQ